MDLTHSLDVNRMAHDKAGELTRRLPEEFRQVAAALLRQILELSKLAGILETHERVAGFADYQHTVCVALKREG